MGQDMDIAKVPCLPRLKQTLSKAPKIVAQQRVTGCYQWFWMFIVCFLRDQGREAGATARQLAMQALLVPGCWWGGLGDVSRTL